MPRDEFLLETKRALASRAGYSCSICNKLTIGPSDERETSINLTGIAAHISAASIGGRRYNLLLTSSERSNIKNGIWLCNNHADLIDGDEVTYTTQHLQVIKKNHEDRIKYKQSGIKTEKGVITNVELSNLGLISTTIRLDFTDKNIIIGVNGTGKTLICDFIASLANKKYLKRWKKRYGTPVTSTCCIYYFKNQFEKFSISMNRQREVSYSYNDNEIPLLIPAITIFYLNESYWDFVNKLSEEEQDEKSEIEKLAAYFQITNQEFISIVNAIDRGTKIFANDISINDSKENLRVKFYPQPNSPVLSFNALSGGEQERVLIEIALKLASYYARFNSTILIIEKNSFVSLDDGGVNQLLDFFRKKEFDFQFFFTTLFNRNYNLQQFSVNELCVEAHAIKVVVHPITF
jgi:hypothetical protein